MDERAEDLVSVGKATFVGQVEGCEEVRFARVLLLQGQITGRPRLRVPD